MIRATFRPEMHISHNHVEVTFNRITTNPLKVKQPPPLRDICRQTLVNAHLAWRAQGFHLPRLLSPDEWPVFSVRSDVHERRFIPGVSNENTAKPEEPEEVEPNPFSRCPFFLDLHGKLRHDDEISCKINDHARTEMLRNLQNTGSHLSHLDQLSIIINSRGYFPSDNRLRIIPDASHDSWIRAVYYSSPPGMRSFLTDVQHFSINWKECYNCRLFNYSSYHIFMVEGSLICRGCFNLVWEHLTRRYPEFANYLETRLRWIQTAGPYTYQEFMSYELDFTTSLRQWQQNRPCTHHRCSHPRLLSEPPRSIRHFGSSLPVSENFHLITTQELQSIGDIRRNNLLNNTQTPESPFLKLMDTHIGYFGTKESPWPQNYVALLFG